ncbi:hypothetical protein ACQUFY_12065 [Robbsia andropogonis]|uniref:hypothetical protein n=1 Tax=Robbsia andropogonis TaxID=28092 RepID=UPI003D2080EE
MASSNRTPRPLARYLALDTSQQLVVVGGQRPNKSADRAHAATSLGAGVNPVGSGLPSRIAAPMIVSVCF